MRPLSLAVVVALCACSELNLALFARVDGGEADAGVDGGDSFEVEAVVAGGSHTCAIHRGALFCWGNNTSGQLGVGDFQARNVPTALDAGTGWVEVVAGSESSCARHRSGAVWCWGSNANLQLGRDAGSAQNVPMEVPLGFAATQVALRFEHVCVVAVDQTLHCWGANLEGQLGQNDGYPGSDIGTPVVVAPQDRWLSVAPGQGHTAALRVDGTVWCWGRNPRNECGLGAGSPIQPRAPMQVGSANDWRELKAAQDKTCALTHDGRLWCWGERFDPQDPTTDEVPRPVGTDTDWATVEVEVFAACGLKTSGQLLCWGRNLEGQLGTGDITSVYTPVAIDGGPWAQQTVGRFHHCALDRAGALFCTGENVDGRLGVGDTRRRSVLTQVRY